jgi:hypothetical protein
MHSARCRENVFTEPICEDPQLDWTIVYSVSDAGTTVVAPSAFTRIDDVCRYSSGCAGVPSALPLFSTDGCDAYAQVS